MIFLYDPAPGKFINVSAISRSANSFVTLKLNFCSLVIKNDGAAMEDLCFEQ